LEELDLSDNLLTGELPTKLGNLSALKILTASSNRIVGPIPSELGQLDVNLGILKLGACVLGLLKCRIKGSSHMSSLLIKKVITDWITPSLPSLAAFQPSKYLTWVGSYACMSSKNYLKLELNLFLFLTAQATTR
jgi:Leucine-rich repeat (LRR) protein